MKLNPQRPKRGGSAWRRDPESRPRLPAHFATHAPPTRDVGLGSRAVYGLTRHVSSTGDPFLIFRRRQGPFLSEIVNGFEVYLSPLRKPQGSPH